VTITKPLLFDAAFLVHFEQDKTRRAQVFLLDALEDGRVMLAPAVSLAVAAGELGGHTPNLDFVVTNDPESPLQILPLSSMNAFEVGALSADTEPWQVARIEPAHVIFEARSIGAVVITYEPKSYDGTGLPVLDMRR
jgi:hypothetical protein